ncbi:hypothetical protein SLEP1_g34455 [Rubroshorea leprosula]|uniref:Uncharacterized protein n=1 Tax=Rubroshorea leprosula TaxID=152421 RepID=A0AAV5KK86_9ROSI|nr:hypothetical protein SLEP1_g34455 [Rubroshorea leprosula]
MGNFGLNGAVNTPEFPASCRTGPGGGKKPAANSAGDSRATSKLKE